MKETNGKAKAARTVSRVQHQGERTVKTKRTIQRRRRRRRRRRQEDERLRSTADGERRLRKKKMRRGSGRAQLRVIFRADLPSCAVQPRNDTIVGAHFGRAGQGPKMDPRRVTRLVERTAVGEGGEDFYIARSGKRADLLVSPGLRGHSDREESAIAMERLP
jgi:hypothetical protein